MTFNDNCLGRATRLKLRLIAVLAVGALVAAACGDDDSAETEQTQPATTLAETAQTQPATTLAEAEQTQPATTPAETEQTQPATTPATTAAADTLDMEPASVTVGAGFLISDAPLFIAQEKGYFTDENLTVEISRFPAFAAQVPLLATGELDVGSGAIAAGLINAQIQGIGLSVVASKGQLEPGYGNKLMVRQALLDDGTVTEMSDLDGLTVAVPSQGSGTELIVFAALEEGGLSWSDANVVYMDQAAQLAALASGDIDWSVLNEPAATQAEQEGLAGVFARSDEFMDRYTTAILAYSGNLASNADVATRFMRAYVRGTQYYNAALSPDGFIGPNADEIANIIATAQEVPVEVVTAGQPQYIPADASVLVDSFQFAIDTWTETGALEGEVTPDDLVDLSFLERTWELLGISV